MLQQGSNHICGAVIMSPSRDSDLTHSVGLKEWNRLRMKFASQSFFWFSFRYKEKAGQVRQVSWTKNLVSSWTQPKLWVSLKGTSGVSECRRHGNRILFFSPLDGAVVSNRPHCTSVALRTQSVSSAHLQYKTWLLKDWSLNFGETFWSNCFLFFDL